ncbi:spindle pole body component 110-like [Herrania umbratica]|uniref:Spindle pole body component 110-like n=1 Tax=Herrania umbratica TaxID=108875 RepID=A0A6J1A5E4_9ROSI|nr:spindle pole body component 110-like [Herrania umbratica]
MDDPVSEWEIQESSGGNSDNGKLRWMMRLGKKILVTGIVVSSAPFVLPPLAAISAIGFFCSVPYGIFLLSYACTEAVMSRLLPMPSPTAPLLLEYREAYNGEEEANGDEKQGEQNEVIKGGFKMEREEKELKEDTIEEVEMRIELVDKVKEELDEGNILQGDAFSNDGVENDEKKSMEEMDQILEGNKHEEDDGEILDEEEESPSQSFEVEVKEITESKVEQPTIEESRGEQLAGEGQGFEAIVEGDKKNSSNIEKEQPLETENVEDNGELVRETSGLLGRNRVENKSDYARDDNESVQNVDAQRKPIKKTELKVEGTTKRKGEQSTAESVNEHPRNEIHEGEEKERGNLNKETTVEVKNVATQIVQATNIESDELVRETRGFLERGREKGRNRDAVEDKQGVKKAKVDAEGELLEGNERTIERKQEQPLIEESREVIRDDNNMDETPLEVKNIPVQLVQAINVEENEKLVIEARYLSEKISDESKPDHEVDDKQTAERVNVGGVGEQSKEIEVKIKGTTKVKVEQYLGDESMSEEPIEEVCNIVVEFEGDEKNGSNIEEETPFQIKNVAVQLSQSTDVEEDEELVSETMGLLEKIRDEGKTDYAVDDKLSTVKEHVGAEKDDKKIVGDIEEAENRCILAHDRMGKPTTVFKPKENKEDNKVQMKESMENLDAASKEMKLGTDIEGLSEKMDVDNIPSIGLVSETVKKGSSIIEIIVKSAKLMERGRAEDDNESNVELNYLLNREKKDVIFSNKDEREIGDEQGLDLLSTVSQQGSPSYVNTFEESHPSSSYSDHQEISDSLELPVSTKAQESDDIHISAAGAIDKVSNEALFSEAKLREQINALRAIVGYKAAKKETCIEELKALYLFTGIEPPTSFKDTSDVVEVNAKLRFLMFVIGVK